MYVKLLAYTPNPEKIVAAAARCCYSNDDPDKLLDGLTEDKARAFIEKLMQSGHQTPLEHVSFTFSISDVSRALLAQLTRHRIGVSFSVRSQRYNNLPARQDNFVIPESIAKFEEEGKESIYTQALCDAESRYHILLIHNIPKEDARMLLPNATKTSLVMTMNARELLHFFSLRCCTRAQSEIRELANEIVNIVKEIAPAIFKKAGPSCEQLGYCPENKMSCGRKITLDQLLKGVK